MAQATISITVNGEAKEVEATTTGVELFAEDKNIIAVKINGENRDLYTPLNDGDTVDPIALDSEDGLAIMRHSATHVMAQAVQEVYPNAKLGVGPVIKDGFYYDFQVDQPFTPNDLKDIEKRMQRIIKSSQSFRRRSVTEEEALKEEADQPFKIELIEDKEAHLDPAAATEISEKELSFYDNVDRDGNVVWKDLCRGPHLPNTRYIKAFKIERSAAAYWRGSEKNPTCSASTAPHGPPRKTSRPTRPAWKKPPSAITASSAPRWTCSPSRMKLAPAWPCSTRRVPP